MAESVKRDWNKPLERRDAVLDVLRYMMHPPGPTTPEELAERCIKSDAYARVMFEETGKIMVPLDVRIVFVATSQYNLGDKGTLVLEMPPPGISVAVTPESLLRYVHAGYDPAAGSSRRSWVDFDDKADAITDVLQHILTAPDTVRARCLRDDDFTAELFRDPRIGNINVPDEAKTIFIPTGEREKLDNGSFVIAAPPPSAQGADDELLLSYVLCCYRQWATSPTQPTQ